MPGRTLPFVRFARMLREHLPRSIAWTRLGISNAALEAWVWQRPTALDVDPWRLIVSIVSRMLLCAAAGIATVSGIVHAEDIPLSSNGTYLHLCRFDPAGGATPIDLAARGIAPGTLIGLEILGDWDNNSFEPGGDVYTNTWAVFSSSSLLLSSDQLHRVPARSRRETPTPRRPRISAGESPPTFQRTSPSRQERRWSSWSPRGLRTCLHRRPTSSSMTTRTRTAITSFGSRRCRRRSLDRAGAQ